MDRGDMATTDEEAVVSEHPELMDRLSDGDPLALVDMLKAAGGKVTGARVRVQNRAATGRRAASR